MPVVTTNLLAGAGNLYHGKLGATEPTDPTTAIVTGAEGFNSVGGTQDGVTLNVNVEWLELTVDQTLDTPARRVTKREATLATNLAEPTLARLVLALNGGDITAGALGAYETYEPSMDPEPDYSALLLEGRAPGVGKVRRVIARKCLQIDEVGQEYKKDGQTLLPVNFATHFISETIRPFALIDQLT